MEGYESRSQQHDNIARRNEMEVEVLHKYQKPKNPITLK